MADIGAGASDRGQLMLVAALTIAVGMVVLVALLNGAIYTQNLAMRSPDAGGHDALQFRDATVGAAGEIIDAENDAEYDSQDEVRANVTQGIERYDELVARANAGVATYAAIDESSLSVHDGTLLRQTDPARAYTSSGGATNWTLATSVPDIRAFSLVVEGGLQSTSDPAREAFNATLVGSGGAEWSVYVYDDGGLTVGVRNATGPVNTACPGAYSATPVSINLTAGTVNGASCPALSFAAGTTAPHAVNYTRGARALGTYNLTVNTTPPTATVTSTSFNGPGPANSPYELPAVYDATFTLVYETSQLRYTDTVRVAPGEPP